MCELCQPSRASLSRRNLLTGAAALLAASTLPSARARADQPKSTHAAPERDPAGRGARPSDAGQCPLRRRVSSICKDFSIGRAERAGAQYPIVAMLSCSDSRVSPELLFDQGPGDVFVVRVAGNFVNPDGLASFEYAVKFLGAPLLMVLGHTNCGAVSAAVKVVTERAELPGHLPELIKSIEPAVIAAHGKHPSDLVADDDRGECAPQREAADRRYADPRRRSCREEDRDFRRRLRHCHRQGELDLTRLRSI